MKLAVEDLSEPPERALIDGRDTPALNCACEAIIGGDRLVPSISAASIVAKVVRDRLMHFYDGLFPGYGLAAHKGYGTSEHSEALRRLGPCEIHRRSFAPVALAENAACEKLSVTASVF